MDAPALPDTGCTKTFSNPEWFSRAETSNALRPRPPARHRLRPWPAMRMTAVSSAFCTPAATCAPRGSGTASPSFRSECVEAQAAGQAQVAPVARHADDSRFQRFLHARGHVRAQRFRNRLAVFQSEPFVESRAEAAILPALGTEEGTIGLRAGIGEIQNLKEEILVAIVAAYGEPLDLVLVRVGVEAQQLGDAAVDIAERIREVLLLVQRHARAGRLPARAATEVAAAVKRQNRSLLEGRGIIRRCGVRQVVAQHQDAAVGKVRAQLQVKIGFRDGAHDRDNVHLLRAGARQAETHLDGVRRHLAAAAPLGAAADELGFFDGGYDFAVLQDGAGGVALDAGDSENDHKPNS